MAKQPRNIRVNTISAQKGVTKNMKVERLSVNSGEEKTLASDMLEEIAALMKGEGDNDNVFNKIEKKLSAFLKKVESPKGKTEDAEGLSKDGKKISAAIKKVEEAVIAQTSRQGVVGGGGEEGGGHTHGSSGGGPGESFALARRFHSALGFSEQIIQSSDLLSEMNKRIDRLNNVAEKRKGASASATAQALFLAGAFQTMRGQMLNFGDKIQDVGAHLTRLRLGEFRRVGLEKFATALDLATSGVENFWKAFLLDFGGWGGRDSIKGTAELIKSLQESGVLNAYGLLGDSTGSVAGAVRRGRRGLIGAGNIAAQSLTPQDANEAMLSLFALQKRRDIRASWNESITMQNISRQLELAQQIAANTGKTAAEVIKLNMDKAKDISELVASGILSGTQGEALDSAIRIFGSQANGGPIVDLLHRFAMAGGNFSNFGAKNPEDIAGYAATGNIPALRAFLSAAIGGASQEQLFSLLGQFQRGSVSGAAGAEVIGGGVRSVLGVKNLFGDRSVNEAEGSNAVGWIRTFQDISANFFGGLIGAIASNVFALHANTMALLAGGGWRTLWKGIKGLGVGVHWLGKSLLKKIPLVGLGASALFALPHLLKGNFGMAGAELASGAASTIPGIGTAASFAIDAGIAANTVGPQSSPPITARELKSERMASAANDTLTEIAEVLKGQSSTLEGIERNTVGQKIEPSLWGKWFGGGEDVPAVG